MKTTKAKITYTGRIPQCPYCQKPTMRTVGHSTSTCMYFPPTYNEQGENINPDRNTTSTSYHCQNCDNSYTVVGNYEDGYDYGELFKQVPDRLGFIDPDRLLRLVPASKEKKDDK